jgi:DNA-binding XRE family transcriptional regulator
LVLHSHLLFAPSWRTAAGIAPTAHNHYEQAKRRPSIDHAIKLCEQYHLTLDWIYRGDLSGLRYATDEMQRIAEYIGEPIPVMQLRATEPEELPAGVIHELLGPRVQPLRMSESAKFQEARPIDRAEDTVAGLRLAIEIVKDASVPAALKLDQATVDALKVVILTILEARMKALQDATAQAEQTAARRR